jgi:hypothetical protein
MRGIRLHLRSLALAAVASSAIVAGAYGQSDTADELSPHSGSVAFGAGTWMTVSGKGDLATSRNGADWTYRPMPPGAWTSVAYGDGRFVAVGAAGKQRVAVSPDGVRWTVAQAPAAAWRSVTHGAGTFVAVADGGSPRIMTSPDGEVWTARAAPADRPWQSVTFGRGMFVAVADASGAGAIASRDGVTWLQLSEPVELVARPVSVGGKNYYGFDRSNWPPRLVVSGTADH